MADRNAGVPENRHIKFRIGINLGDLIVEGDDFYGDGVNMAARLEGLARHVYFVTVIPNTVIPQAGKERPAQFPALLVCRPRTARSPSTYGSTA
jgi:class 3 adenylate cyclase